MLPNWLSLQVLRELVQDGALRCCLSCVGLGAVALAVLAGLDWALLCCLSCMGLGAVALVVPASSLRTWSGLGTSVLSVLRGTGCSALAVPAGSL